MKLKAEKEMLANVRSISVFAFSRVIYPDISFLATANTTEVNFTLPEQLVLSKQIEGNDDSKMSWPALCTC